jgi:hypothetical protein
MRSSNKAWARLGCCSMCQRCGLSAALLLFAMLENPTSGLVRGCTSAGQLASEQLYAGCSAVHLALTCSYGNACCAVLCCAVLCRSAVGWWLGASWLGWALARQPLWCRRTWLRLRQQPSAAPWCRRMRCGLGGLAGGGRGQPAGLKTGLAGGVQPAGLHLLHRTLCCVACLGCHLQLLSGWHELQSVPTRLRLHQQQSDEQWCRCMSCACPEELVVVTATLGICAAQPDQRYCSKVAWR